MQIFMRMVKACETRELFCVLRNGTFPETGDMKILFSAPQTLQGTVCLENNERYREMQMLTSYCSLSCTKQLLGFFGPFWFKNPVIFQADCAEIHCSAWIQESRWGVSESASGRC